jgi:hypothetical protein
LHHAQPQPWPLQMHIPTYQPAPAPESVAEPEFGQGCPPLHVCAQPTLTGSLEATSQTPFLLIPPRKQSTANATGQPGLQISADRTRVSLSSQGGGGRGFVVGSRSFARGMHYWEVKILAAEWGSVFVGVCPVDVSEGGWPGWGFLNYRATQRWGAERIYGNYYTAGDTVGVLLDADRGRVSFIKDGEDFNSGRVVVNNLGMAFSGLRTDPRAGGGTAPRFSPCLGLRTAGDALSINGSRFYSQSGFSESATLTLLESSLRVACAWSLPPSDPAVHTVFPAASLRRALTRW